MTGGRPWQDRYCAVRSRVIFWILSAPLLILVVAAMISATVDQGAAGFAEFSPVLIGVGLYVAIAVRMMVGWDLLVRSDHLVYRSAFRNVTIAAAAIESVAVDEGRSTSGLSNLMIVTLHLVDSSRVPLKLFNCFRPTPESPSPLGFRRMVDMAEGLNAWLGRPGVRATSRPSNP